MPEFTNAVPKLVKKSLQFPKLEIQVSPLAPGQGPADAHIQLSAVGQEFIWESADNGATWNYTSGPIIKRVNVSAALIAAVPAENRAAIYGALEGLIYAQHAADEAALEASINQNPIT